MATILSPNRKPTRAHWWTQWRPYPLVLALLILFPLIAGVIIGDPSAVQEGSNFFQALMQRAGSGYANPLPGG
jgi:hypothetical protein